MASPGVGAKPLIQNQVQTVDAAKDRDAELWSSGVDERSERANVGRSYERCKSLGVGGWGFASEPGEGNGGQAQVTGERERGWCGCHVAVKRHVHFYPRTL